MDKLIELLEETVNDTLFQIILSNSKDKEAITKVKIRPIIQREQLVFQASEYRGTKVIHINYEKQEMIDYIVVKLEQEMKQIEVETTHLKATGLISKKGKLTLKKKLHDQDTLQKEIDLSHNRKKKYILEEGKAVGFLIDLGVQTIDGTIVKARYDKFKQINRFLEFIEDIIPALPKDKKITILDFGCGKSYLTFAMYYYLKELKGLDIQVIGLDLKKDVIETCNQLRDKYRYEDLTFLHGDIVDYTGQEEVDMVVTLHACDTATDYALEKAVKWNAKVILSVPCCQHEVNKQIKSKELEPILKYGLIKERMSALITDALRANLLSECGYDAQILEFIDMEHTPKNILIRGVKRNHKDEVSNVEKSALGNELEPLLKALKIEPTLLTLLKK